MNYITDGQVTYHHAVSPQEVWGDETCAERAFGKAVIRSVIEHNTYGEYGEYTRAECLRVLTSQQLITWQEATRVATAHWPPAYRYDETTCAYCHGLLTEDPLPDDYPIGDGETPNSPLTALRQQLQRERDAQ